MILSFYWFLLFIVLLVLIEGFFSGSEIALLSADKLKLMEKAKKGDKKSQLALKITKKPEKILSITLLITNFCMISISSLFFIYFHKNYHAHASTLAISLSSPLVVLLGELIPKTIYQKNANFLAPWVAYPISFTYLLFYPITKLLSYYTTKVSYIITPIATLLSGKSSTTRDEIQTLLNYHKNETEIKSIEKKMIKRIFDFHHSEAKRALIPLVKVEAIDVNMTLQQALECFEKHRHSRMPVYEERIDNIIGTLESIDLFSAKDLNQSIRGYITPAHYVAETQSLKDLMIEMRHDDQEMVIVVDEHGGAIGILTFEDIIEEIVGEIKDEFDKEITLYKTLKQDRKWLVQAHMEIQQINEILKIQIPQGHYETLSGFLLQQFGRIPEIKDELFFNTASGNYQFIIYRATERHIETVIIEKFDLS